MNCLLLRSKYKNDSGKLLQGDTSSIQPAIHQKNHPRNIRGLGHNESRELFSVYFPVWIQIVSSFPHHKANYCTSNPPACPPCNWASDDWWDCFLPPFSILHVPRVTHYACKRPRLPRWSSHAKAWSTTVKFLNLYKIICAQVSEHVCFESTEN